MSSLSGPRPAQEPGLWLSTTPVTVTVTGSSMEPFLKEGDRVELVRAEPASLGAGMIVAFRREDGVVIHRLLAARPDRLLEKGDAQGLGCWRPWPPAVGRALAVWRSGRKEDLATAESLALHRRIARAELRRHRVHAIAARLPGSLLGRILRRLAPRPARC
jgi:hypothetical protein